MTKTVLIDATYPDSTPRSHGRVTVKLIAGTAGGVVAGSLVLDETTVQLDADGHGEVTLATNDTGVTSPSGSFYRFTVVGSSPTISRSIMLTADLPAEILWTDETIQVVHPVAPEVGATRAQLAAERAERIAADSDLGATHQVGLFATDVDMSGGDWTDLPVYGPSAATVPRGYLAGAPVLVVDGDDWGLWTVTASGPSTPGPTLEPGDTIGCIAGGVGWWATAASADGSTVAGVTVAATGNQLAATNTEIVTLYGTTTDLYETITAKTSGLQTALDGTGAWRIEIAPWAGWSSTSGWVSRTVDSSSLSSLLQLGNAAGFYVTWDVWMAAGTWAVDVLYRQLVADGSGPLSIAGTTIATINCYAASTTRNVVSTTTGITVASSGLKTVKLATATAGAGGGYALDINWITLRRTA